MAKAEKMNRGVSSKKDHRGGNEIRLPDGIHSFDSYGNIFASLPQLSPITPKYYTLDQIKTAFEAGKLEQFSSEDVEYIEKQLQRSK